MSLIDKHRYCAKFGCERCGEYVCVKQHPMWKCPYCCDFVCYRCVDDEVTLCTDCGKRICRTKCVYLCDSNEEHDLCCDCYQVHLCSLSDWSEDDEK